MEFCWIRRFLKDLWQNTFFIWNISYSKKKLYFIIVRKYKYLLSFYILFSINLIKYKITPPPSSYLIKTKRNVNIKSLKRTRRYNSKPTISSQEKPWLQNNHKVNSYLLFSWIHLVIFRHDHTHLLKHSVHYPRKLRYHGHIHKFHEYKKYHHNGKILNFLL